MIDGFLMLTPILLLAIIALLGFVGCYQVVTLVPASLTHEKTTVKSAPAGTQTATADALTLLGGEFIVVAVQWSSAVSGPDMPSLSEASLGLIFSTFSGGGPFTWNNMSVQTFTALNPLSNTQFKVTASLLRPSTVPWNLCVSAYAGVEASAPLFSPQTKISAGPNLQTPAINIASGDLIYAVAFAANSDGTFPGNSLSAGTGFAAEFPQITNPLVEDGGGDGLVTPQATNANKDPNATGFMFAMGLKSEG